MRGHTLPSDATDLCKANITIRDIDGAAELHAIEDLQKVVWRTPDLDVVPLTHFVAVQQAGGLLLGAFDDKKVVGFVYGFPSYEYGELAHHSHMLAVKPEYRNFNLGKQLKLAQRERVLTQGIKVMTWTFDPLQSLNAHFNFNKLGVVSDRYLVNFYGEQAASFLHRTGTDRLWVKWLLNDVQVVERLNDSASAFEIDSTLPLIEFSDDESPQRNSLAASLSNDHAYIQIPGDITGLQVRSNQAALAWREATRWAFREALNAGYRVTDFQRTKVRNRYMGTYLLCK